MIELTDKMREMRARAAANLTEAIELPANAGLSPIVPDGVAGACHVIDITILAGCIPDLIGGESVVRSVKRTTIADGRADYVLFHPSGAATVIEVADDRGDDFVLAGLKPLFVRGLTIKAAIEPAIVRCVLACNCDAEDRHLHRGLACQEVGVGFVPLGTNERRRKPSVAEP